MRGKVSHLYLSRSSSCMLQDTRQYCWRSFDLLEKTFLGSIVAGLSYRLLPVAHIALVDLQGQGEMEEVKEGRKEGEEVKERLEGRKEIGCRPQCNRLGARTQSSFPAHNYVIIVYMHEL